MREWFVLDRNAKLINFGLAKAGFVSSKMEGPFLAIYPWSIVIEILSHEVIVVLPILDSNSKIGHWIGTSRLHFGTNHGEPWPPKTS